MLKSVLMSGYCVVTLVALVSATQSGRLHAANLSAVAQVESGQHLHQSVAVNIHLQANAKLHETWPGSSSTWHYGTGYIEPFGPASYYCGEGFPEQKSFPLSDWVKGMMGGLTGRPDGLFCVYVVADGNLYVYDSVVGSRRIYKEGLQNDTINVVVGGTGAFKGVTGVWLGMTEGRGQMTAVTPGRRVPEIILKIMQGYIRLPDSADGK